jgi:transcriptional regulator with XRE-family HTH domain
MEDAELEWPLLLAVLRALRGWSQEELAAASGVSISAISKQELGVVSALGGTRERLEEALGVSGWTGEIQLCLGPLRATMLDPEGRYRIRGIAAAGVVAARITEAALGLALADLRRTETGEGGGRAPLEWPVLLTVLRMLRGWFQEELATASGVSTASISRQECGVQAPTRAAREKLEAALGVRGRTSEIEIFLGQIRARMLDPRGQHRSPGIAEAGKAAAQITEAALRLGLEEMRKP